MYLSAKESNKSRFDSYSVRNSVLRISHITFRDCRVHIFSDNLSRNSCISFTLNKALVVYYLYRVAIILRGREWGGYFKILIVLSGHFHVRER